MTTEEKLKAVREWAEDYPSWLAHGTDYSRGYRDAMFRAHDIVLDILNNQNE